MSDIITLTGRVGTEPTFNTTDDGLMISSFRLVSNHNWFDRKTQAWVEGSASWFSVKSFRQLAENVHDSVHKGDLVVVTGRLRVREWERGDRKGISVDVDADSIGHDLAWGRSVFTRIARNNSRSGAAGEPPATVENAWASTSAPGESANGADRTAGGRPADYEATPQQSFLPGGDPGPLAS